MRVDVLLAVLLVPAATPALERTSSRPADDDGWNASPGLCTVSYYNVCTGWVWLWQQLEGGERVGVVFDPCCDHAVLSSSAVHFWTGTPAGYGFTGVYSIHSANADGCPIDPPLVGEIFLPRSGWNTRTTNLPLQGPIVASVVLGPAGLGTATLTTDHPAAGPTGPTACGMCYPTTRATHSFRYGTVTSPLCPGSPLDQGLCDVEVLWMASMDCADLHAVESRTWASIKALYR